MSVELYELPDQADINDYQPGRAGMDWDPNPKSPFNLAVNPYCVGVGDQMHAAAKSEAIEPEAFADAFYGLFTEDVWSEENPANEDAINWWEEFFKTQEAKDIRCSTILNPAIAECCGYDIARQLDTYLVQLEEQREEQKRREEQGEPAPERDENGMSQEERNRMRQSVKEAARKAEENADDAGGIMAGMSQGFDAPLDSQRFRDMFRRISRSRMLRNILNMAGGMWEHRLGKKMIKQVGYDTVEGITQSGDWSKICESELAAFADADMEDQLLRRVSDEEALSLERYSEEPSGKGPMVVLVDESGSMGGTPICQAKAFALTMARIAQREKRWVCFASFTHGRESFKWVVFKPEEWGTPEADKRLLNWLEMFMSGGTDFEALRYVTEEWDKMAPPEGKADMFFITDMNAHLGDDLVRHMNKWRKANDVRCFGLAIRSGTGDMPKVCDESWSIDSMGLEEQAISDIILKD